MRRPLGTSMVGLLLGLGLACAKAPAPTESPAPIPTLDLSPRCLVVADLPALGDAIEAPAAGPPNEVRSLPQGFEIHVAPQAATPVARLAVGIDWPSEAADDAAIVGGLVAEGWTAEDPAAFRARAATLGVRVSAELDGDRLWISTSGPASNARALVALLADLLELSSVDDETFARVRRQARLWRIAEESLPATVARERFDRVLERAEIVDGAGARESGALLASLRDRLHGGRAPQFLLVGAAPSDVDSIVRLVAGRIETWPSRAEVFGMPANSEAPTASTPSPEPGDLLVVDRPGSPQVEILVGVPNATYAPGDAFALELLASGLGGNVGGRLFADLRERGGLVYTIDARQDPERVFFVTTRARATRVPAVVSGIEAHLRALVDTPFLPCEVGTWRQRLLGEAALERADPDAYYATLRREIGRSGSAGNASRAGATEPLDPERLADVARRHLNRAPIVILVGDQDSIEAAVEAVSPHRTLREVDEHGQID